MPLGIAAITERLRKARVPDPAVLAGLAVDSLRISATPASSPSIALGVSRFGGAPDVPHGFLWPTLKDDPLSFIAQIDLTEFRAPGLPDKGWLLFFYDAAGQPWGFDPKDAGGARVLYVDGSREELKRPPHPETPDGGGPFKLCALTFTPTVDLPDVWDSLVEDAGIDMEYPERVAYAEVAAEICGVPDDGRYHHLLGHPQLVQNDMRTECQLVTSGTYCGDPSGLEDEAAQELLRHAAGEWQLLLQVDTDEDGPGWMWGDSGRIFFWIRRGDLAARCFEKVWLILQCG
jgi:uncharacterized protein YwqG